MKLITALVFLFSALVAHAGDHYVNGYVRQNGVYVQSHYQTNPDNTVNNNYGTRGNVNPYTQQEGIHPQNLAQPQGVYNQGNGMGNTNYDSYGNVQQ